MPRVRRELESQDHQPAERVVEIAMDGDAEARAAEIEVVRDTRMFKDMAEELAFNEETLTIYLHPSAEKYPEPLVQVAVNGRRVFLQRGKNLLIKRKYVERLARAKVETVQQDVTAKDETMNRLTLTSALKYPFMVKHDPNPKGEAWLQQVLESGA